MNRKRILAWLLALVMIVGMTPSAVFAEEVSDVPAAEAVVAEETAAEEVSVDEETALPEEAAEVLPEETEIIPEEAEVLPEEETVLPEENAEEEIVFVDAAASSDEVDALKAVISQLPNQI